MLQSLQLVFIVTSETKMPGKYTRKTDGTGRIILNELQKREIFEMITSGAKKKEVESRYFEMTQSLLKENTYKGFRKAAKKRLGLPLRLIRLAPLKRIYSLPEEQQNFENKVAEIIELYDENSHLQYSKIREILMTVQKNYDAPVVTRLKFTHNYINRFIRSYEFGSKVRPPPQKRSTEGIEQAQIMDSDEVTVKVEVVEESALDIVEEDASAGIKMEPIEIEEIETISTEPEESNFFVKNLIESTEDKTKIRLKDSHKKELFKLITDGGTKREIEMLYFTFTDKHLKHSTYKKYRKDAKKCQSIEKL